ncbi:S41 family peptidase [Moorella sulfitireducens]|uniref:S41 family peptidase n=1 Tax=Neomoorella sulfitireducens TaxID=2972948 RepID=UPI0021AC2985|nr:S41 family peptidase [Moorella sulfitireducens]
MVPKTRRRVFFLAFFFAFFLGRLAAAGAATPGWSLLDEVYDLAEKNYPGFLDREALEAGAVRGLVDSLGDPYGEYIAPGDLPFFTSSLNEEYTGVGVVFQEVEGQIVLKEIVPGSPAARAGVKPGSVLVAVDGRPVTGLSLEEIGRLLEGTAGTYVEMTVTLPGSSARRSYYLRREVIRPPVTGVHLFAGQVGYLYLRSFPYWAPEEMEAALAWLEDRGARGLILDLRGNPGGYLDAALETASLFLLPGKPVVQLLGRDNKVTLLQSRGPGQDLPVVILVDRDTASAAEVLAGALQANHAALLIGTRTYGKGAVQTIFNLSNGGALKLTTAYFLTPGGRAIDGEGLKPDIEVAGRQEQLDRALQVLRAQIAPSLVAAVPAGK